MRALVLPTSALLLLAACATSSADKSAAAAPPPVEVTATGTPGQASAQRVTRVRATVKAVNAADRTLTVQDATGASETIKVDPAVKRFGEVAVGDVIEVQVEEGLLLEYQPASSPTVDPAAVVVAAKAPADMPPGGAAAAGVQGTVTVGAIDLKTRLVTIQTPGGDTFQVKAGPAIALDRLKVGDRLLATYVQTVAIGLEKAK